MGKFLLHAAAYGVVTVILSILTIAATGEALTAGEKLILYFILLRTGAVTNDRSL